MKSMKTCLAFLLVSVSLVVSPQAVMAQEMILQHSTPVEAIHRNCDTIQPIMRRLHTADSLTRVNYGQIYNDISSALMARFNSRLALNRFDATKLIAITNQFEQHRAGFAAQYNDYERELSGLMKIDCRQNPAGYYASLIRAREQRAVVAKAVVELNTTIADYRVAVEKIAESLKK